MSLAHRVRQSARDVLERVAPTYMHHRRLRLAAPAETEIALLPVLCEPGTVAIDVGANKGLYVDHLRAAGANVIAFEPYPHMARQLRRFYRGSVNVQNSRSRTSTGARSCACRRTTCPGLRSRRPTASRWRITPAASRPSRSKCVRLDEFEFRNVSFIKIDVEGHEEAVLKGAHATLVANHPCLLIEIEERHNAGSVLRIALMLATLGYENHFLLDNELHPYADFDPARHQPPANVGERGKTGVYVNNFIFVHASRAANVVPRLRAALINS